MRVLVLANENDAEVGLVGRRFEERGVTLELLVREDHTSWPELAGFDALVSLGSEWSVYWDHVAAPVQTEVGFLRAAHDRGLPTFGICFGSQLLAVAHSGSVQRAPASEIGWYDVAPASGASATLAGPWFQWHDDRWTPPPGAELLATSELANQAFRLGRTLAVQFHPEVTLDVITRWVTEGGGPVLDARGVDRDAFLADSALRMAEVQPRTDALVDWFLEEIAGTASTSASSTSESAGSSS